MAVTEDGFEYAGMTYPSISEIAKKITHTLVQAAVLRPLAWWSLLSKQGRQ
jgi:hypothetical protein